MDDEKPLEIKIKSIETTLIPLVNQISTLVSCRERGLERSVRGVARVGQAVNLAVERFVTVGETIGDDNPEIRHDMYDACKEAREAGSVIEKLCEVEECLERSDLARAARALLAAVTRVLLLADIVVVKQLLLAKDKVARSLGKLENVTNFTEFVKAFSQFGAEMVELAHLTGDRQSDTKDERRRAQMHTARQVLERSTMLLLVSSKTCLRHPECQAARENRDTVFCQMRRAMDLIHYVVKDGVLDPGEAAANEDWEANRTVHGALLRLEGLVQTALLAAHCQEGLAEALEAIIERTQDFTDSANTSHDDRERMLDLLQIARDQLDRLISIDSSIDGDCIGGDVAEHTSQALLDTLAQLRAILQASSFSQAGELERVVGHAASALDTVRNLAMAGDPQRVQTSSQAFTECTDQVLEICKLVRHMAPSDSLQVGAKYTEINVRIYGPQVITAATALATYPTSKIAKENLEVFADMWEALVADVAAVSKEVMDVCRRRDQSHVYLSLPRPGKHGTTSKSLKPSRLDSDEQARIAKSGLEMKLATSEVEAEADKWRQDGNNDIVKRARNMSGMAFSMYQFTKGEGTLKTTQDLFTQAEYFAEEANRLYKVARQFSYQVPAGAQKKELLESLSGVPTHVQQLQFTVKDPTVGKAATFSKVDLVIHETKSLMNIISKVVTNCFVCCNKYNIDLGRIGSGRGGAGGGDDDGGCGGGGAGGDGKLGAGGGSDPTI